MSIRAWAICGGLAVGAAVIVGSVLWLLRPTTSPPPPPLPPNVPPDPRLTYNGPYRNIHPAVQYVGDGECAICHDDKAATFREHPMGRSLFPIADVPAPPPIDAGQRNPFAALGTNFRIERANGRTWHHQFLADRLGQPVVVSALEMKYAIGSGTHGQSYLWEQDGYVQQSPISWFGQKRIWDASPGWHEVGGGRPVAGRCLFCHTNRVDPLPGYANRYATPLFQGHTIGCERCHGPGESHVARWGGKGPVTGPDHTIVNPRKLDWRLREAVCRQCHSEGEARIVKRGRGLFDFRPGMPLEDFWAIVVRAEGEEEFKVVNHVEQMERSRCFQKGRAEDKLGCISCHDPHVKPAGAERIAHFRRACLNCHEQRGCTMPVADRLRQQLQDSCIACHMPPEVTQDVPHVSGTDHRIMRRPTRPGDAKLADAHMPPGKLPVRLLHRAANEPLSPEDRRDLGVALGELLGQNRLPPRYAGPALEFLDAALRSAPDDTEAWEMKGVALERADRLQDAYVAYMEALKLEPTHERCLTRAALLAIRTGRTDDAIDLCQRARALNPWRPLPHAGLALLHAGRQQWREGKEAVDAWVRIEPALAEARRVRTQYLLRLGDRPAAAREFAILEALNPPNLAELRTWWEAETQSAVLPTTPKTEPER